VVNSGQRLSRQTEALWERLVKLFAVIVCYHPEPARVLETCVELRAAGVTPVLVDNTEHSYLDHGVHDGCRLLALRDNTGVARAQNVGIRDAIDAGADAVLFLDQDSKIDRGCVAALWAALSAGRAMVVGPVCVDETSGIELPATRLGSFGLPRPVLTSGDRGNRAVDVIISSGTLATRAALAAAGPMDEELFIDFVDTEWCLRCRSRGISIEVVKGAVLRHSIGTRFVRVGPLTVLVHSPVRCYYQIRNCFLLLRRGHVPRVFALHALITVLASRTVLLLFVTDRMAYAKAYAAALWDGFRGRGGRWRGRVAAPS
jgi:rhamnosyltransferase